MRITENFSDAETDEEIQVSLLLEKRSWANAHIKMDFSSVTPRIRVDQIDTFIQMLEALKRRAIL